MTTQKERMYKVYHIRPIGETDTSKYYVGVTKNSLEFRLLQHFTSKRPVGAILRDLGREAVEIVLIGTGSKAEALEMEYRLRPAMNIGWNCRAGGDYSTVRCSGCGKPLPKRKTGAMCDSCNPCRFVKGAVPVNKGTGVKAFFKSPTGEVMTYTSITDFCKEHGLQPGNLRKVIKGLREHTKGWTLVKNEG